MASETKRVELGADTFDTLRPGWVASVDRECLEESSDFAIALLNQVFGSRQTAIEELSRVCTGYMSISHMLRALGLEVYNRRGNTMIREYEALKSRWLTQIELPTRQAA